MTSPSDTPLGCASIAFVATLGLVLASAVVERTAMARASGLRRPALLGPVADVVKVMARSRRAAPGSGVSAFVALLPALGLVALLPPGAGVGGLLPSGLAASGGAIHALLLLALLAVSAHAWLLPAAFVDPCRRRELIASAGCLPGCHLAALLVVAGLLIDGSGPVLAGSSRAPGAWPLWTHPAGAAAWLGILVVLSRCTGSVLGGRRAGLGPGSGPAALWLPLSRHLQRGAVALLAFHLFCGGLPWAAGWAEVLPGLTAAAVLASAGILGGSLSDATAEGLTRVAWARIVPLALIDVSVSVLRSGGWMPWS